MTTNEHQNQTADLPRPPVMPCGSCPYRRDVASGVWDRSEYLKLTGYDGETWQQSPALFLCHQKDGHICGGWLACHDTDHLLALRLHQVDNSAYGYHSSVPVFSSGLEACAHGLKDMDDPGLIARRMINKLARRAG